MQRLTLLAALLATTFCAHATDGAIEINQTRALAGGVTPGDSAGFPVTISRSGSYRLTSNLDVTGQPTPKNVTAIDITSDNVTIDLNGFAIIGPNSCHAPFPPGPMLLPCPQNGTGVGIGNSAGGNNVTIANGTVHGMGNAGIKVLGDNNLVERIKADQNGADGIAIGNGRVSDSTSMTNFGNGISLSNGIASHNFAGSNGGAGISILDGLVTSNSLYQNGNYGLNTGAPYVGYVQNVFQQNYPDEHRISPFPFVPIQIGVNLCGIVVCP